MDIYEQIVELRRGGRRGAVATIVNVRGSIPSFRTAKMLVRDDGSIVGTIGGGCVEADVWQAAREVMESEKPRTLTFDLNVTDDRTSYATKERFPAAREVHALEFDEAIQKLEPNETSYIVIVTRGHPVDMRSLRWPVQP